MSVKLVAVWYLLIGMSATLTGQTNAFFSDSNVVTGSIQAGTWGSPAKHGEWDKSSLKFTSQGFDQNIFAAIKNTGEDMTEQGKYEIYFNEKGNPQKGKVIPETLTLTFEPLKKGQEIKLIFTPEQSGKYMFKAYQHKDHQNNKGKGKGNIEGALWSKEIIVDLTQTQSEEQEQNVIEPENQVEIKEPKDQEESVTTEPEVESGTVQFETKPEVKPEAPNEAKTNNEESIPPTEKVEEQVEKQTKETEVNKEPVQAEESTKEENPSVATENSDE